MKGVVNGIQQCILKIEFLDLRLDGCSVSQLTFRMHDDPETRLSTTQDTIDALDKDPLPK